MSEHVNQVASCNLPVLQQEIEGGLTQTVNARDLHQELGIKKKFPDWIKSQIERGQLVENADYVLVFPQKGKNLKGGRPALEYHVTIDAGKSIAMMSGGEKGAEVRRYFIQCEKQLKRQTPQIPQSLPEALRLAADLAEENTRLECQVAEARPKVDALDRIATAEGSLCITDAAKQLQIQPKTLFKWLNENQWIYRRPGNATWIGYQQKIQQGLLEHKMSTFTQQDGTEKTTSQVRITPKGLTRLSDKINQEAA